MKTLHHLFSAAATLILLAACTAAPTPAPLTPSSTPTPSAAPSLTPTLTPTPPPAQTSQPTSTSPLDDLPSGPLATQRPAAITYYDGLPPGQYLVFRWAGRIYAMTADQKQRILLAENLDICYNSSDGRLITVCEGKQRYLLDMQQGRLDPISLSGELSPDGRWAAHDCSGSELEESLAVQQAGQAEICLVQQPAQGTLHDSFFVAFQGWSPDGKWLAYTKEMFKRHHYAPHQPEDGLYLMDTGCLSAPETCAKKTQGPYYFSGINTRDRPRWFSQWSPDGRFVALYPADADDNRLFFFNVETRSFRAFPVTGGKAWVDRFAISPDGATLAYIRPMYPDSCCSFLEPISGGPSTLFGWPEESLSPLFWLTVPSFTVGQALKVSARGARLNLREQPSMGGKVITHLAQGAALTILEGPSGFGTYVWWKVRVEKQGMEGWVIEVPEWFEQ